MIQRQLILFLLIIFSLLTNLAFANDACQENTVFKVGAGIYDITGPAAEEGMMGYGMIKQQTAGIYQRLWARAFVIESPCNGKRIVFVNVDLGQVFQAVKEEVVRILQQKYPALYSDKNVLITATHEHSGPGGYSTYTFYNLTSFGFSKKNFETIVNGIVAAIERAQNNMTDAQIKIATGEIPDINFNRSPTAYLQNPENERARYTRDTDIGMTLIRFDRVDGTPIGMLNWFPIHGVSMNNKNHLITGDNKGYAEYFFEKDFHSDYGSHAFVAAFAQANAGDVSPNQLGQEGGNGLKGLEAIEKAGKPQYEAAKKLYANASVLLKGGIDYRHTFVAMDNVRIDQKYTDGEPRMTCPAAIGVSMLAGTQDGEGIGRQGITCDSISSYIPHFVCEKRLTVCQGVKPIAIQTGLMKPHPWTPNILPFQMFKIGNLVIAAAPFELTTMTGRRIKESIKANLPAAENDYLVLSALANAYAGYVATNDEYQIQRYEGASTHFGPWASAALQQEFANLTKALVTEAKVPDGPTPANLLKNQTDLQPGVLFDDKPLNRTFGAVYQNVKSHYLPGETAEAIFWGGHPKNDYRTQDTFLEVQHFENGEWHTIARDRDWDTEYAWQRSGVASSLISIKWRIPKDVIKGQYRLVHNGNWKSKWSKKIYPYTGYSSVFTID